MTRESEAPRVRTSVPVEEDEVGDAPELLEGADRRGGLAKGEVAGDVRKARGFPSPDLLDRLEGSRIEDDDGGEEVGAATIVGDVHPRDEANRSRRVPLDDA
jgi:hypothetical protein